MTLQTFGRYKIVNLIGQGGMAEVYAAKDPELDRLVALKIILKRFSENPKFQARFLNEAKIIAGLEHRAILPVYDFGQDESTRNLYLVMRLMPDVLHKRLERLGPVPLEEASLILNRLAVALNRAHSENVVHRDIKPANILLDEEGTVFLADFGLAAPVDKIEAGLLPPGYGGSPFYMAPEQWCGEPMGPHTDIYQLGVTLFEMLTGERPFPNPDPQQLSELHQEGRIPNAFDLNPRLPQAIQPILAKAMAKSPTARHATVLELANDVANLLRPWRIKRRYEIKEELQHGRFAVVYQAHDLMEDQPVALKILKEPLLANHRYRQEFLQQRAEMLRLPQHPALVPIYDADLYEDKPFIAMKFVEGASLRGRFRKESSFSVSRVCEIATALAQGLDALHEAGQVHGDINMGNVLIDSQDNCLLTDFHITAVAELTQSVLAQAAPLAYLPALAPEQWAREPLVPQTDVYQFALLLYELLAGQRPFAEAGLLEMQQTVAKEPPPPITSLAAALPPQFDAIFAKALAKKPDERYASATALVQAMQEAWQSHAFETFVYEGEKYHQTKQWDKAIEAYQQARQIRPNNQAVAAALDRAERRKQDALVLEQTRVAIDNKRWRDADYFLSQVSDTLEKKALQEQVQRQIALERLYSEGKLAMQRQEWLQAQKLLDEADSLEPNYLDVNALLGELAETIESQLRQAREALDAGELERALALLKPVAGHETAVALRQQIEEEQKRITPVPLPAPAASLAEPSGSRLKWLGWSVVGVAVFAVFAFWFFNRELTAEEKLGCVETAVAELHITHASGVEFILSQGGEAPIPGSWQEFGLSVEWDFVDDAPARCQRFFAEDDAIKSEWDADSGTLQSQGRWDALYNKSPSSPENDRIVATLLYDGQPLPNAFLLDFDQ